MKQYQIRSYSHGIHPLESDNTPTYKGKTATKKAFRAIIAESKKAFYRRGYHGLSGKIEEHVDSDGKWVCSCRLEFGVNLWEQWYVREV